MIVERPDLSGELGFRHAVAYEFVKLFSSCLRAIPIITFVKEYAIFRNGRDTLDYVSITIFA